MKRILLSIAILALFLSPATLLAADDMPEGAILEDKRTVLRAKVLEIIEERESEIPAMQMRSSYQRIRAEILEGPESGETVVFENDYLKLKPGEKFFLQKTERWDTGETIYYMYDKMRLPAIYFFLILFVVCTLVFGGWQGARGLASLIGSIFLIAFVLLPGILEGYSPVVVTIAVSSLIIVVGSYITHGFNRTTSSAVAGMIGTILITGALAYFAVRWAGLSGFESEESVYLNWNTGGTIDFVGLLFGGIMIGLLGVLYDVAIGQAITIEELREAGKTMSRRKIFERALRIGKEHVGALVNTLAIAYVGASLPLLLLFYGNTASPFAHILNGEVFATEIIRIIIGSIGLILAVPITTLISVVMLVPKSRTED